VRVLVDYRPALKERTGVGEYVHELARALVQGPGLDEVALFTSSWKDRPSPDVRLDLAAARLVDRRVPGRLLTLAWNRMSWPPIESLAGEFDVVHAATPVAIPSRSAAVVLTIHDLHFLRHPERMAAEMRRDFPSLVRRHARRAPAIVVSSAYTAGDVERTLGVAADRIHLCPPGAPGWTTAVRERRRSGRSEHILFLGTLDPRKNVGALLEAYRLLRSRNRSAPPLVLAGSIPSSAAHWQEAATRTELAGHVRFTGYVTQAQRQDLFARAHMLVLPSLDEGFGLPVLEAMACGVPVVVSSGGSLPEVAGDAATPVAPADVDGLAAAMASLLEPDVALKAAARGVARAATFRWDRCAERVRQAYASSIGQRS
jgi:glycosyltransferase involved in cell wall biosynthesis